MRSPTRRGISLDRDPSLTRDPPLTRDPRTSIDRLLRVHGEQIPILQVLSRQGPRQQETLHLVAAARAQPLQLPGTLNSLCRDDQIETLAQRKDCVGDGSI